MALLKHADLDNLAAVAPLDLSSRALIASGPMEPFLEAGPAPTRLPTEDERQLADLRQAIKALEDKLARDVVKAHEEGRKQAELTFVRDEAARLSLLKSNLDQTTSTAAATFVAMEKLALVICEEALAKIFAKPASYRALVADAIAKQLATLRRETVLGLHVSPQDFPDSGSLEELASATGAGAITIQQDRELRSGDCRISVRLGHIELSISDHWDALKSAITSLLAEASHGPR